MGASIAGGLVALCSIYVVCETQTIRVELDRKSVKVFKRKEKKTLKIKQKIKHCN